MQIPYLFNVKLSESDANLNSHTLYSPKTNKSLILQMGLKRQVPHCIYIYIQHVIVGASGA